MNFKRTRTERGTYIQTTRLKATAEGRDTVIEVMQRPWAFSIGVCLWWVGAIAVWPLLSVSEPHFLWSFVTLLTAGAIHSKVLAMYEGPLTVLVSADEGLLVRERGLVIFDCPLTDVFRFEERITLDDWYVGVRHGRGSHAICSGFRVRARAFNEVFFDAARHALCEPTPPTLANDGRRGPSRLDWAGAA